ncbi:MAG: hypothetical protein P1S46_10690 [bacterium]|nr:hypothetical protein [bacterium]MDT8396361.1 hypothetical protein [bacterium]
MREKVSDFLRDLQPSPKAMAGKPIFSVVIAFSGFGVTPLGYSLL